MDISALMSGDIAGSNASASGRSQTNHPYPTRHGHNSQSTANHTFLASDPKLQAMKHHAIGNAPSAPGPTNYSPHQTPSKTVEFQLHLSDRNRGRLPLRVSIHPTDRPESILNAAKNFWGIYEGQGISLEDEQGNILIPQYENFIHNSHVVVKVFPADPEYLERRHCHPHPHGLSVVPPVNSQPQLGEPFQMVSSQPMSRQDSHAAKRGDASSRPDGALLGLGLDDHYSDSDGASITSSKRARGELPSMEISLENIVEGGRRKQMPKFESSELPLFAPPQQPMTMSVSSMSPQRRFTNGNMPSPGQFNNQRTFSYSHNQAALSPQGYGFGGSVTPHTGNIASAISNGYTQPSSHHQRSLSNRGPQRLSNGGAAPTTYLPTPDPTVGSVISDEDVAWQLMRLGEPSNMSSHGRPSTSTLDETLSGKAEAASDEGDDDSVENNDRSVPHNSHRGVARYGDEHGPARKKQKYQAEMSRSYGIGHTSNGEPADRKDGYFKEEHTDVGHGTYSSLLARSKTKSNKSQSRRDSVSSKGRPSALKAKSKPAAIKNLPPSPYVNTTTARKVSAASVSSANQDGEDEDLSTKPRCQRCRKSKKGCDRQRPCQRCKDAGIGIEGCISEDEGNGRKGRFGRHMGVPVAKLAGDMASENDEAVVETEAMHYHEAAVEADASRKRKR